MKTRWLNELQHRLYKACEETLCVQRFTDITGVYVVSLLSLLVLVRPKLAWTSLHGLESHPPDFLPLGFTVLQIGFLFSVKLLMEVVSSNRLKGIYILDSSGRALCAVKLLFEDCKGITWENRMGFEARENQGSVLGKLNLKTTLYLLTNCCNLIP